MVVECQIPRVLTMLKSNGALPPHDRYIQPTETSRACDPLTTFSVKMEQLKKKASVINYLTINQYKMGHGINIFKSFWSPGAG